MPGRGGGLMGAREFFDGYGKMIFETCVSTCRGLDEGLLRYEYCNYRKVALVHNMGLSREMVPEAIARIAAAVVFSAGM